MVAAELPLRGKLRAEATTFPPTHSSCKCLYECLQALLYRDLSYPVTPELPRAQPMGKTGRADRACSAGCVCPTSNPAARAARAVPTPTRIVLFGAARREIPLVELGLIVRIKWP